MRLLADGEERRLAVRREGEDWIVTGAGEDVRLRLIARDDGEVRFACEDLIRQASFARDGDDLWLDFDGACRRFADLTYAPPRRAGAQAHGEVRSPVNGIVVAVEAQAGQTVQRGQALATVEAMKMQYEILAPIDGVIAEAHAVAGRQAQARALLFSISPKGA